MKYDSKADTLEHILNVQKFLNEIVFDLLDRAYDHDETKLKEPEKSVFDEFTPKLSGVTYGSDEYREMLKEMKPAIDYHHSKNRHHPEFHKNGIDDMTLIDIVEMFCDWKAATLRHKDGSIYKSIDIGHERFGVSQQLSRIFLNTAKAVGW